MAIVHERDTKILACFPESHANSHGISLDSLIGKNLIYKKYNQFEAYLKLAEKIMLQKHIDKYISQDKLERINNEYRLK